MMRCLALLLLTTPAAAFELPAPVSDADYRDTRPEVVAWGRLLFWDPILSGNRNISCGTCHHPLFGTGDGLSLGLGEGGVGLGPDRATDPLNVPPQRIARNAPGLWNLGAAEFTTLFHDGHVAETETGIATPLPLAGYGSALAAQTVFPVISDHEMAGHGDENEISRAVAGGAILGPGGALDLVARRVDDIPAYQAMWQAAFPEDDALDFPDIAEALAQFVAHEWRSDTAPFDHWMRGEAELPPLALRGLELFYGAARCATCHSGPFQTDHQFHAMAQPQLGPGQPAADGIPRDEGRGLVTGNPADRFAFRTPSLRNVTETGPWGHAGAYGNLRHFVRDHATPRGALPRYERQAILPAFDAEDWVIMETPDEVTALRAAVRGPDMPLSADDLTALMAFLETLRDVAAFTRQDPIPDSVPSGLRVDRGE